MPKVVIIGGSGHIGSFLVPNLVDKGYDVTIVSRGTGVPYTAGDAWGAVERVFLDRGELESKGAFGTAIAEMRPDSVVDLICYTPESCRRMVEALRGNIRHYLQCGSIWVHGISQEVPTPESAPYRPLCEYGKNKAAIEALLVAEAKTGFPATVIHPGHISGPGWAPINPAGNLNLEVFSRLARGEELCLPNFGLETLHHVHAADVAALFIRAMERPEQAIGQAFHAVSPRALTLRGYAEAAAGWFGKEAHLTFLPWETWRKTVSEEDAAITINHIERSPSCSMKKAAACLGFTPAHTSLETAREALLSLEVNGGWDR